MTALAKTDALRGAPALAFAAADRQQATPVVANFRQVADGRPVKAAPPVMRLIDPEVAAKLGGR